MESFLLASIHTLYFVEQPASFLPTQKNTLKRSVKKWKNNTKSGPCLEISCATIFQPRIPAHLLRCILHTACTLFPGTDLKYNPPAYFWKLTIISWFNLIRLTTTITATTCNDLTPSPSVSWGFDRSPNFWRPKCSISTETL